MVCEGMDIYKLIVLRMQRDGISGQVGNPCLLLTSYARLVNSSSLFPPYSAPKVHEFSHLKAKMPPHLLAKMGTR
jgi:hypothetical protein